MSGSQPLIFCLCPPNRFARQARLPHHPHRAQDEPIPGQAAVGVVDPRGLAVVARAAQVGVEARDLVRAVIAVGDGLDRGRGRIPSGEGGEVACAVVGEGEFVAVAGRADAAQSSQFFGAMALGWEAVDNHSIRNSAPPQDPCATRISIRQTLVC